MRWAIWLTLIEAIVPSVVANAAGPLQTSAQFQPIILAQAGSTGGTIGKQDKSASGGTIGKRDKSASGGDVRVPAHAHRAPIPRKHHVLARAQRVPARQHHVSEAAAQPSRCPNIVGEWDSLGAGLFGHADTTFDKNGTAMHKGGIPGKWWCESGELRMSWAGLGVIRYTVARDGKRITQSDGIVAFTR